MKDEGLTVTIHLVSSLDGIIAKTDNSVSWFDTPDHYEDGVTTSDSGEFLKSIDCYVMGSTTYEHALALSRSYGWVYGDKPTIVVSKRRLAVERSNVEVYSGDLDALVNDRLRSSYKNVWVVGGAKLVSTFLRLKLADEIRLTILPLILGEGTKFIEHLKQEQPLHLKNVTAYKSGMVELWYEVKKSLVLSP